MVGYLEKNCCSKRQDACSGKLKIDQYGEWLRATPLGRKNISGSNSKGLPVRTMVSSLVQTEAEKNHKEDSIWAGDSSRESQLLAAKFNSNKSHEYEYSNKEVNQTLATSPSVGIVLKEAEQSRQGQGVTVTKVNLYPSSQENLANSLNFPKEQDDSTMGNVTNPLVNIPVLEASNSGVLLERGKNVLTESNQGTTGKGSKRWKRAAGKENQVGSAEMRVDTRLTVGTKRTWALQDEEKDDDIPLLESGNKKLKSDMYIGSVQVEEASLKWP